MGEELGLFRADFNRPLRVESRPERITGDVGAVLVREVIERLGIGRRLEDRLIDPVARLAVSTRRGIAPLKMRPREEGKPLSHNPAVPDGLAS